MLSGRIPRLSPKEALLSARDHLREEGLRHMAGAVRTSVMALA